MSNTDDCRCRPRIDALLDELSRKNKMLDFIAEFVYDEDITGQAALARIQWVLEG